MAKDHEWFATYDDAEIVVGWLRDSGATLLDGSDLPAPSEHPGREVAVHFPNVGPVEFWPAAIRLDDYGEQGTPRWKRACLARLSQERNPGQPQIDVDGSAVAGMRFPEFRDARYWVAGHIWFPTANLKVTFPKLHRICQQLERFLLRFPTVYDNRKGEDQIGFGYQLCMSGALQKVVALPQAHEMLEKGAFMIDSLSSPKSYRLFRRRLQLAGYEQ